MSGTTGTTESTILNKIGNYAKTNFVINWASGSVIATLMFFGILMYFENAKLKEGIESQKTTITELKSVTKSQGETINTINITFEAMKSTIDAFRANPPSTMDEKINGIHRLINVYHNRPNNTAPTFHNGNPTETPTETPTE